MPLARFILSFIAFLIGIVLVIPAVLLALPPWLVACIGKIIAALMPKTSDWEDIVEFDSALGWRAKPHVRTRMKDGGYSLTTGADGWRGRYNIEESNVVVLGDSFVFGQGADDKNHFARLTNHAKVKPIGAPGYGTTHYLLLLKSLTQEIQGKLVIWFVFTGNDYREAIRPTSYGYHFPFTYYDTVTRTYTIRTDNLSEKKLPFNFEKGYKTSVPELADLYYKNYLSDYAFGAFGYLAGEAKKHCEENGATFAVVTIPLWWVFDTHAVNKIKRHCSRVEEFSPRYPDQCTAAICERLRIPFRAGSERFTRGDFLRNDFHFSRAGNQKAANIIDELYISFSKNRKNDYR